MCNGYDRSGENNDSAATGQQSICGGEVTTASHRTNSCGLCVIAIQFTKRIRELATKDTSGAGLFRRKITRADCWEAAPPAANTIPFHCCIEGKFMDLNQERMVMNGILKHKCQIVEMLI
jgi:hypothetical protein